MSQRQGLPLPVLWTRTWAPWTASPVTRTGLNKTCSRDPEADQSFWAKTWFTLWWVVGPLPTNKEKKTHVNRKFQNSQTNRRIFFVCFQSNVNKHFYSKQKCSDSRLVFYNLEGCDPMWGFLKCLIIDQKKLLNLGKPLTRGPLLF